MTDFALARRNMVEGQLRPNQVRNADLIAAMAEVPRELFVPREWRDLAYVDDDVSLGSKRWLMAPTVFARLAQAAAIKPTDRVLDVGAATGYGPAILSALAAKVIALECDGVMARQARRQLGDLRKTNVTVVEGELADGHPAQAPYDVIVIESAVPEIPHRLSEQLADGGRLVAVVRAPGDSARAQLVRRVAHIFDRRTLFDAVSRVAPGFATPLKFVF